jgi:flagellar protein FlaG
MGAELKSASYVQAPLKGAESFARPEQAPQAYAEASQSKPADVVAPAAPVPQIDLEKLKENLEQLEKKLDRKLSFSIDETIDRVVIVVRNEETGEEIRKLPDEATLKVAHSIESLKGLLFDDSI